MWTTCVIFKKLPRVNNRPLGEKSGHQPTRWKAEPWVKVSATNEQRMTLLTTTRSWVFGDAIVGTRLTTGKEAADHLVNPLESEKSSRSQCCQMAHFQTRNPNLSKFWRALHGICWYISGPFGIFYGYFGIFYVHLVPFVFIWYIFSGFGITYLEKSGNPGSERSGLVGNLSGDDDF
jgi:hypothetical protein